MTNSQLVARQTTKEFAVKEPHIIKYATTLEQLIK